ncbi:MAG: hypothetical protein ACOYJY_06890, partial [Acutalibacteraceae bacterium]
MDHNETKDERKTGKRGKRRIAEPEFEGDFFVLPPDMEDDDAILHTVAPAADSPEAQAAAENVVLLEELVSPADKQPQDTDEETDATRVVTLLDDDEQDEPDVGDTRMVETESDEATAPVVLHPRARPKPKPVDEVEGQLKLDDWEEEPKLDEDWQERLRRTRQEQIEDFERRREKAGMKITGEEEQNDPVEEAPVPEEEEPESDELEDYGS